MCRRCCVRPGILIVLEKNIRRIYQDIDIGKDFLKRTLAARKIKSRTHKLFCNTKRHLYNKGDNLMRRQQREQEEIFASYMSHRSLTPRLHKELKMSNTLKPNISSEERNEETKSSSVKYKQPMNK